MKGGVLLVTLLAACHAPGLTDLQEVLHAELGVPFPVDPTPCLATRAEGATSDAHAALLLGSGIESPPTYRIPALMRTLDGGLLLVAERRNEGRADQGDIDLISIRSADDGDTWSTMQTVADNGIDTVGNPTLVYDLAQEKLLLLSVWRPRGAHPQALMASEEALLRVMIQESVDHGRTWSSPQEITNGTTLPHWRNVGIGPGRGMQFIEGPWEGRIVVTAWFKAPERGGSYVTYSDDGGRTWSVGAIARADANGIPNEAVVALLGPDLMFVMRLEEASRVHRTTTWSLDGGQSFVGQPVPAPGLPGPRVHGSTLVCHGAQPHMALHLAPRDPETRRTLCFRVFLHGTWGPAGLVQEGAAAYNDMVELGDGRIAVAYEGGPTNALGGIYLKRVSWERALAASCPV